MSAKIYQRFAVAICSNADAVAVQIRTPAQKDPPPSQWEERWVVKVTMPNVLCMRPTAGPKKAEGFPNFNRRQSVSLPPRRTYSRTRLLVPGREVKVRSRRPIRTATKCRRSSAHRVVSGHRLRVSMAHAPSREEIRCGAREKRRKQWITLERTSSSAARRHPCL